MLRTFLRQSLVVLVVCALYLPIAIYQSVPAEAASITLADSNCDSFTLTGTAPNQTLTCVVSNPPVCTVTGSANAQLGSNNTLTASCSPAATSWVWTQDAGGTGCSASVSSTCTDNQANAITINYRVTGSNANGAGPQSPAFPVAWSNTVVKPSGCVLSPGSSTQSAGYQATFSVSCSGGSAPTSWSWSGGGSASCNTASCGPLTFNSSATVNVTPANSAGNGNQASAAITIGGGGGGNVDTSACVALGLNPIVVTVPWGLNQVKTLPNFGPNDALIIQFTTSSVTTSNSKGQISAYEFNGPTVGRAGALSASPCDFTVGLPKYNSSGATWFNGQNPNFSFTLVNPLKGYAVLAPNTPYYLNITNFVPAPPPAGGTQECWQSNCPMQTLVNAPSGTY